MEFSIPSFLFPILFFARPKKRSHPASPRLRRTGKRRRPASRSSLRVADPSGSCDVYPPLAGAARDDGKTPLYSADYLIFAQRGAFLRVVLFRFQRLTLEVGSTTYAFWGYTSLPTPSIPAHSGSNSAPHHTGRAPAGRSSSCTGKPRTDSVPAVWRSQRWEAAFPAAGA